LEGIIRSRKSFHYAWIILFLSVLTTLSAIGLARFGYTMILPPMREGLGLSKAQTGYLQSGNMIGYLSLALIGGFLASHFSPRKVISVSLLVVGGTMVLTGMAAGFVPALFWRTLTGMGSGGSNVPVMGLLSAWFSPKRRGLATGIAVTGSSLGLIITGPLVPYLLDLSEDSGWRVSWFVIGGMVLLIAVLAFLLLRDRPDQKGLQAIGEETKQTDPASAGSAPPPSSRGFKAWGLVYKSGVVWHLAVIYLAFGFSYIIYATFFAEYLQTEHGYTKEWAGNMWQLVGWVSLVCGVLWGWVSDVIGRKYALAIVSLIQAVAYVLFAWWPTSTGVLLSVLLFGVTAWAIPAIMASACGDHLGSKLAPAALGFVTLIFGIGQALAPSVAGGIAQLWDTFVPAFLLAAGVAFLGGVASMMLKRAH
jgi:sugar phosphate permease